MLSTSCILKLLPGSVKGIPSITYNGSKPRMFPGPLTIISASEPGSPLVLETTTPATLPCKASATRRTGRFLMVSPFIEDIAPVMSFRF